MELKNKVAVVTGSSSGIGKAIAIALAKEGVKVVVNSRKNIEGGRDVSDEINKEGGESTYVQADLSYTNEVKTLIASAVRQYKKIDILVNNAGDSKSGSLEDLNVWKYQLENILLSAVAVTAEFANLKTLSQRKIVNISSIYGSELGGNTSYLAYGSAKAALNSLTVNLAKMFGSKILVNAVAPGWTWTPPWGNDRKKEEGGLKTKLPIGRFIETEEIAQMVIAILKNDAITGQIITVDGGATLKELY